MARYLSERDIEGFRECFFLNAPSGYLRSPEQLTAVMRSLNFSPTKAEARKYFRNKAAAAGSAGVGEARLSFADFLDVMHVHSGFEDVEKEVLAAFRAWDKSGRGYVSAADLRHVLTSFGERLTHREVDALMKEANIASRGQVRYEDFVKLMLSPPPDYY